MAEWKVRECRTCGEVKPCPPNRRQCRDCNSVQHLEWAHKTGRHKHGRQAYYRQHREIEAIPVGESRPVTCRQCGIMKWYFKLPNGKGRGWKRLTCPECSNAKARAYTAKRAAEGVRSGPCSKCGKEGPYHNGRQCKSCFNAQRAAYHRQRRADGKGRKPMPVYSPGREPYRSCSGCRERKLHIGAWSANRCPACAKASNRKSRAALKQRMVAAGEWTCHQCGEVKAVDEKATGWQAQTCPPCTRARDRARKRRKSKSSL